MKLQVVLLSVATVLAALHISASQQKPPVTGNPNDVEETYAFQLHHYVQRFECSIRRSLVQVHNLMFSEKHSLVDAPSQPDNLRVSDIGSNWVQLLWDSSASYTAESAHLFHCYDILVIDSRNATGYVLPFAPASHNVSSFNVSGLQGETSYEFSVTAVSEKCEIFARSQTSNLARSITKPKDRAETSPANGILIAGFEGATNLSTLLCSVFSHNQQTATVWSVKSFTSDELLPVSPNVAKTAGPYNSMLTIQALTPGLDNTVVYCGTEERLKLAHFRLRIYRPPKLKDGQALKIREHSENIFIDLSDDGHVPFPEPQYFALTRKGRHTIAQEDSNITFTSSSVLFPKLSRSHSGSYSLSITNFMLNSLKEVGTFTSTFQVDVLYGPEISPGPKDHYVLSGDSVSLICGYNLNSYPPAVISWTSPHGDAVRSRSGSKYSMDNGPGVVRLNISDVTESLGGEWTCQVEVFDSDVLKVEEGRLIRDINTTIGRQTFPTYLHVLVRPSPPFNLSITDCGLTCIQLHWHQPDEVRRSTKYTITTLSRFEVKYTMEDGEGGGAVEPVESGKNTLDFSELLPGKAYLFTVTAVSLVGDVVARSPSSDPIHFPGFDVHMKSFPPSGSQIVDHLGAENFATLNCSILARNKAVHIRWSVQNFKGNSDVHVLEENTAALRGLLHITEEVESASKNFLTHSHLTIRQLTSEFDNAIVYCGTEDDLKQANFTLKVYYPPAFESNLKATHALGDQNVSVDLGLSPSPFPKPNRIKVEKDGQRVMNMGPFGSFSLINGSIFFFREISAEHAGTYQLTATNYHLDNTSKEVGTCIGTFTLDVTYGPELTPGPGIHYVLYGQPISLVCVYNLKSNPPVSITWTDPSGNVANDGGNFEFDSGLEIVQIHIKEADVKYRGKWNCSLWQHDHGDMLKLSYVVTLVVVEPPLDVLVMDTGPSWVSLQWSNPSFINDPHFSRLEISTLHGSENSITALTVKRMDAPTESYNMTSLDPSGWFEFTVAAVSDDGNFAARSLPSHRVYFSGFSKSNVDSVQPFISEFDPSSLQCPPKLKDNVEVSITEGVRDISVDLGMYQTDRVEAAFVSLSKTKGQLASMGDISVSLRNTTLYFENVTRQHSGRYTLSLTNDCENGGTVEARTEVGSITLNVLYGPEMKPGAERYVILQNDSVSLTCGYDLNSNPRADITWRYPNGSEVSSSDDRIEMVYEQGVVQLRISDANLSDSGSWACIVEVNRTCVNDEVLGGSRGSVCDGIAAISQVEREIELVVVVPPGKPYDLTTAHCGPMCIQLNWKQLHHPTSSSLSHYEVSYVGNDGVGATQRCYETYFNFSNLSFARSYQFRVVAVSVVDKVIGRSPSSDPFTFPGFDASIIAEPKSGTQLIGLEDASNFVTLMCSTYNRGDDTSIIWSLKNFRGNPSLQEMDNSNAPDLIHISYHRDIYVQSQFTVLKLSAEFDKVIVFCGTEEHPLFANFTLRIYHPPVLQSSMTHTIREGEMNFSVHLSSAQAPFPTPHFVSLQHDDRYMEDGISITHDSILFQRMNRRHAGNYSMHVANRQIDSPSEQLREDVGSFSVNVEYGPEIMPASKEYTALEGCPVSLLCGYNLESNPPAIITWIDPEGNMVTSDGMYIVDDGPRVLRLNISRASGKHEGVWTCNVMVKYSDGSHDASLSRQVHLRVLAAPSEPMELSVDQHNNSLIVLSWSKPADTGNPHFCHYELEIDGNIIFLNSSVNFYAIPLLPYAFLRSVSLWAVSCADGVELKSSETKALFGTNNIEFYQPDGGSQDRLDCSAFNKPLDYAVREQVTTQQEHPPSMDQPAIYSEQENSQNVALNFGFSSVDYAKPVFTSWSFSGSKLVYAEPPMLVNSSVLVFNKITREHSGKYTLTNRYCHSKECNEKDAEISWTLILEVHYGPDIHVSEDLDERFALSGEAVSLVCGYNLDSYPKASITWTDPNGRKMLQNNDRYTLDSGPEVVRLNISEASQSDSGVWTCSVSNGRGTTDIILKISLEVIVPSSPPFGLTAVEGGTNCIDLTWSTPEHKCSPLSHYEVSYTNGVDGGATLPTNDTHIHLCKLTLDMPYWFEVVAVSVAGNVVARSVPSDPIHHSVTASKYVQTDHTSGSVIAGLEGSSATITCNVFSPKQPPTVWHLQNLQGNSDLQPVSDNGVSSMFTIRDGVMTISSFTPPLDGVVVFCGTDEDPRLANFTLRIIRPPYLEKNSLYKIVESANSFSIDLSRDPPPFPSPDYHVWNKTGVDVTLNGTTISFDSVTRRHTGIYSLTVASFYDGKEVGRDTGNFTLDVLYGPEMVEAGEKEIYVLLDHPVTLVCGYNLDSNPQATVTWTNPQGEIIGNSDAFRMDNGPAVIQLNITKAEMGDEGMWKCQVNVASEYISFESSEFSSHEYSESRIVELNVKVVVPPGQPTDLAIVDMGSRTFNLSWTAPSKEEDMVVSHYEVVVIRSGETRAVYQTTDNFFKIDNVELGYSYEFSVAAVSEDGGVRGRSLQSDPVRLAGTVTFRKCNHPSGSILAGNDGSVNFATVTCVFLSGDVNRSVVWSVKVKQDGSLRHLSPEEKVFVQEDDLNSKVTISNLNSDLDGAVVYCGVEESPELFNFTLRVYRLPHLLATKDKVNCMESTHDAIVDLGDSAGTFPRPSRISLDIQRERGKTTEDNIWISESQVIFRELTREDIGNYSLSVTNYQPHNSPREVGTSSCAFFIDVTYGPELVPGPSEYYVRLNDPVTLICGYKLSSSPSAQITWTHPQGHPVEPGDQYILDNGPQIVRLNISNASKTDGGVWRCSYTLLVNGSRVNAQYRNVSLTIVGTSPQITWSVATRNVGSTWIDLQWMPPLKFNSQYEITCIDDKGIGSVTTHKDPASLRANITDLQPETTYEFVIVAVNRVGDVVVRSPPSDTLRRRTTVLDFITCELPSGSVVAGYEDSEIALSCSRIRDGQKSIPNWTIRENPIIKDDIVRMNLTSDLDGVAVHCGTEDEAKKINFTLRVYRPPHLPASRKIKATTGTKDLWLNIYDPSKEFPKATFFKLEKFGKTLAQKGALTVIDHSNLIFHEIKKDHSGTYTFSVINYHLENRTQPIGVGATDITLDVLYGPVMTKGPGYHYVIPGDPVSLICCYDLESNPPAKITWTDPQGNEVKSRSNYFQDDGPGKVQLNISEVAVGDSGAWQCSIEVAHTSVAYNSNGTAVIGNISHKVQLNVIETQLLINLSIAQVGDSWIFLKWTCENCSKAPEFEVTMIVSINGSSRILPVVKRMSVNITNLELKLAYDFTVTAVLRSGGIIARSSYSNTIRYKPTHLIDIGLLLLVITSLLSTVTATAVVVKQLAKGKSTERPQTQTHITDSPTSKETLEETHSEPEEIQVPGKPTGKLSVKHVTTNSVTLSWGEPDTNSELVTGYSVLYCIVKGSNQKPPSDAKWSQYSVFGNMRTAEVKGLRSNVTYVFKVRPESENGSGQESDLSKTKTEQSLADYVRSKSQLIKEKEGLHILKPPIQRRKSAKGKRKSPSFTRCDIIGKSKQVDAPSEKVLLVVGATGAGKSTLINGIANYIMGVSWNDDFRFQVIVDEKEASQAQSQTKKVTAYSFHGSSLPYILTVIDTPGFGDTEGMDRDKVTVNQIKELFSTHSPECVDQIHGVGFVIQASSPRLTQSQRFIFDSVLSIFGKDIASNIFLMMTFADSQKPPVLSAIKEAAIPYQQGFAFNNSALYANHSKGGSSIDEMFWNLGKKNFSLFFTEFEKAEAHSLQLTRENLNERQQLEVIVEGLKLQIRVALTKIDVLRQKKQILRRREADILRNENFEYELTVTKQRLVDLPSNVSVTNCTTCNFTCHYPCPIPKDEEKYRCKAMDSGGKESAHCTVCPGNCPWSQHVNASQRFELYYVVETHTSDELKKNLSDAIQGKNEIEGIISDIEKELEMLQGVIVGMVREAKRSLERLQEIALKPNPLSETEYIDLLIKDEKSEKRPGYIERIKAFEIVKTMVKEHDSKGGRKPDSSWWKDVTK